MNHIASLGDRATDYLNTLCREIPERPVGSAGNRAATTFFRETISALGFETECQEFDCIAWSHGDVRLRAGRQSFEAFVSPYSLGTQVRAPLVVAATVQELAQVQARGAILLARGDLTHEPLMPKQFPFYNPEEHQHIVRLLEAKAPAAIVAATSRHAGLAGGMYPFPWIEDGDFDIPSVYTKDTQGERFLRYAGQEVTLEVEAARTPSTGCNVVARRGGASGGRVVVCAHIDSKEGTPGALDDGTGVAALLLLAELLESWDRGLGVEIVALNGEDTYHAVGQVLYLERNAGRLDKILLAVNLDAAGYHDGRTAYSLYECPDRLGATIRGAFGAYGGMFEGPQWPQGDHMIFAMNGRPAVAITSEQFPYLASNVTHTDRDVPEIVDVGKLVVAACALSELLHTLDTQPQ